MARELGIRDTVLTRWKPEAQHPGAATFAGTGKPRDEELARIKRELARVKKERDFFARSGDVLNRFARLMAAEGLQGWLRRKRRGQPAGPAVTPPPGGTHLLQRDFFALEPETKWIIDITEIKTQQGKLYLCVVLDLYDQRIVGWSTHEGLLIADARPPSFGRGVY